MGRMVKRLSNLEIDEVSLVDRPANQHGLVAIAKNHQEEVVPYFDAEGREVFQEDIDSGAVTVVYDESGREYEVKDAPEGDEFVEEEQNERELASVGKRGAPSLSQTVLEELSKALTDEDRDKVFAKALERVESVAKRNTTLEQRLSDIEAEREFDGFRTIAKSYDLGDEDRIATILHKSATVLEPEEMQFLDQFFTAAGEISKGMFEEVGVSHYGQASGILDEVFGMAGEAVAKNAELGLSQEVATTAIFSANPEAYDAYEAEQRANR